MVIELDDKIDEIISFFKNLINPENLTISSFLGIIPLVLYILKNKKMSKLEYDGIWKQDLGYSIDYFIKVKRDNGEGEAEGVKRFVGIKDKIELNPSRWITRKTETDIATYDYLSLFRTCEHKGHKIITFHTKEILPPPDDNNLYENNRYHQFEDDEVIIEIISKRARIKKKQFRKKIEDIVNDAKPILM